MPSDVSLNLKWDKLPLSVLVAILSFLGLRDRRSAATTCKSWNNAFSSPQLWKSIYCEFCYTGLGYQNKDVTLRNEEAAVVAKNFGQWCRSLTVNMQLQEPESVSQELAMKRILKNLQEFFKILATRDRNPSLRELHFFGDWPEFDTVFSQEAILVMALFIRTQTKLNYFSSAMSSGLLEGCLIMDAVSRNSLSIRELDLQDHLEFSVEREEETMYRFLSKYSNLTTLYLPWRDLGESLLCTLVMNCKNSLKLLHLSIFSDLLGALPRISPKCWEKATALIPQLRVGVALEFLEDIDLELFKEFLPNVMPVVHLCVWGNLTEAEFIHYYHESFSETLESAELHQPVSEENYQSPETAGEPIDDAILAIVSNCSKLKSLHVYGKLKIKTLSEIIDKRISGCISLQTISVNFSLFTPEEEDLQWLDTEYILGNLLY